MYIWAYVRVRVCVCVLIYIPDVNGTTLSAAFDGMWEGAEDDTFP